jgi:hypothetical protein
VTPTFSIADSPGSATVNAGQSATTTITVTPAGGFNQQVSFACSGLPSGATCTFSPTTVTPSGGAAATTALTIATPAQSSALEPLFGRGGGTWALILPAAGFLFLRRRRKGSPWNAAHLALLCLLAAAGVAMGCGGSGQKSQPKPQTSTITVTATAGSESETATFTLTVQ